MIALNYTVQHCYSTCTCTCSAVHFCTMINCNTNNCQYYFINYKLLLGRYNVQIVYISRPDGDGNSTCSSAQSRRQEFSPSRSATMYSYYIVHILCSTFVTKLGAALDCMPYMYRTEPKRGGRPEQTPQQLMRCYVCNSLNVDFNNILRTRNLLCGRKQFQINWTVHSHG